jgi:hypothetical protein
VKSEGLKRETNVFVGSYTGSTINAPEKTIAQIINENIGYNNEKVHIIELIHFRFSIFNYFHYLSYYLQGEHFFTRGTVVYIKKENMFYAACPDNNCNKKVIEDGENSYRCEKCSRSYDRAEYRYVMLKFFFALCKKQLIIILFIH